MNADLLTSMVRIAGIIVGCIGIGVILVGVVRSFVSYVCAEFDHIKNDRQIDHVRYMLGTYLLLGLEFLIAADILETIFDPTLEHIVILGGIVIIRTVLNFFLNKEIEKIRDTIKI